MSNFYQKSNILFWRIEAGSGLRQALPNGICTPDTPDISGQMPPEVALLLPGPHSAAALPDKDRLPRGAGFGVFLANPILNITTLARELRAREIEWVANLPSVIQHDEDFLRHLNDVGLGFEKETALMSLLCDSGLRVLAAVADAGQARQAAELGAAALVALPPVAAFEAGFPSMRERAEQVARLRSGFPALRLPLLGLLSKAEGRLPATWPDDLDGGLIRPSPVK